MLTNGYHLSDQIVIGNETAVCQSCVEKLAAKKSVTKTRAAQMLHSKFLGKKMLRIGNILVCKDCVRKANEELFAEELAVLKEPSKEGTADSQPRGIGDGD